MNSDSPSPPPASHLGSCHTHPYLSRLVLSSLALGGQFFARQASHAIKAHSGCPLVTTHTIPPPPSQQAAVTAEGRGAMGQMLGAEQTV